MKNKTTYTRTVTRKSSSLLGGWRKEKETVTRKAHNRKRSYAKTTTRRADFTAFGIMAGISLGCLYLHYFSDSTLNLIYPSAQAQEVVAPVPTPEPVEGEALAAEAGQRDATPSATSKSEKQQILEYIVEVFGDDAADAIVVIRKCENAAFNPKAVNVNRNGSVDRGIFQLNSQYWGGEELFDWKTNVDKAYEVFTRAGKKWTPWTCAHVVDQKNYLGN